MNSRIRPGACLPCLVLITVALSGCQLPSGVPRLDPRHANNAGAQPVRRGTVETVRNVVLPGRASVHAGSGSLVGAAAGTGVGRGLTGKGVGITGGLLLGAVITETMEEYLTRRRAHQIVVHLDDDSTVVVTQAELPPLSAGDRVLVVGNRDLAQVLPE